MFFFFKEQKISMIFEKSENKNVGKIYPIVKVCWTGELSAYNWVPVFPVYNWLLLWYKKPLLAGTH